MLILLINAVGIGKENKKIYTKHCGLLILNFFYNNFNLGLNAYLSNHNC